MKNIEGRLHFNDSKKVAPFPTIFLLFSNKTSLFRGLPCYFSCTVDKFLEYLGNLYE